MTPACIGWHTDPPCPVYGYFHGCKRDDPHPNEHVCVCGAVREWQRRERKAVGT